MEKTFRAILDEYLDEPKAAPRADVRAFAFAFEPLILPPPSIAHVTAFTPKRRPYAREERQSRINGTRARQPRPEPVIAPILLNAEDLAALNRLVELGGIELADGLSARRLKTAYRRLAKQYHPDANVGVGADGPSTHDLFLDVRRHYGRLLGRLDKY